jgi:phosphate transport system substrate-binding protein
MRASPWITGLAGCLLVLAGSGCGEEGTGGRGAATGDTVVVVSEPEMARTVRAIADEFVRQYPGNRVRVEAGGARDAMGALFAATAQVAVIGREISDEERDAARRGRIAIEATRWARDGLAMVVHPSNPVETIAFDDLHEIYSGKLTSWAALGGNDRRIVPVVQRTETGTTQFFVDRVLAGERFTAPAVVADDDSSVAARVARDPAAIGFVSLPFASQGVKALAVSAVKGMPYVDLDAQTVYEGRYPLTRYENVVLRTPSSTGAEDLNTFLCSTDGQRKVLEAGYVPVAVPIHFTHRAPTLPSH